VILNKAKDGIAAISSALQQILPALTVAAVAQPGAFWERLAALLG